MLNQVGVDSRLLGDLAHPRSLRSRKAENHKDGIYYDDCYREDHIDIILIGKTEEILEHARRSPVTPSGESRPQ